MIDPQNQARSTGLTPSKRLIQLLMLFGALLPLKVAAESPLAFKPLDDETYAETVTLFALLKDQSYLLMQTMLTNGGVGDEKPGCRILFIPAPSRSGKVAHEIERGGDWSYHKETLTVGTCVLKQSARGLIWNAQAEGLSARVSLSAPLQNKRLPTVRGEEDDEFFSSGVLSPWVKLEAKLRGSGLKVNAEGVGTLNHTRSTLLPPKLAKRWFKLYALQDASSGAPAAHPLLLTLRLSPQGEVSGWAWRHGEPSPRALSNAERAQLSASVKSKLSSEAKLKLKGETLTIHKLRPLFTYEPVRQYGMMGRLAKRWIGDPINQLSLVRIQRGEETLIGITEEIEIR